MKQDIGKLKTPLSLICKCCSFTIKLGLTIFSLQWHFKYSTRITLHSRSLLHVIMISCPPIVKDSGVVDTGLSDYSMVFCILKLKTVKPHPTHIHARSLKHIMILIGSLWICHDFLLIWYSLQKTWKTNFIYSTNCSLVH